MGLSKNGHCTQKNFPVIFTVLINRNVENLTHSFLGHGGKVPNRAKWACPKDGQTTQKYFPVIFTAFINEKKENLTHIILDMTKRSQTRRNGPAQKMGSVSKSIWAPLTINICKGNIFLKLFWGIGVGWGWGWGVKGWGGGRDCRAKRGQCGPGKAGQLQLVSNMT